MVMPLIYGFYGNWSYQWFSWQPVLSMVSMVTGIFNGFHGNGYYLWFPWQRALSIVSMAMVSIKNRSHLLGHNNGFQKLFCRTTYIVRLGWFLFVNHRWQAVRAISTNADWRETWSILPWRRTSEHENDSQCSGCTRDEGFIFLN